jgi:hypothetical protein
MPFTAERKQKRQSRLLRKGGADERRSRPFFPTASTESNADNFVESIRLRRCGGDGCIRKAGDFVLANDYVKAKAKKCVSPRPGGSPGRFPRKVQKKEYRHFNQMRISLKQLRATIVEDEQLLQILFE